MKKKESYKSRYEFAKAHEDVLIEEIASLQAEITELRFQNESLKLENKNLLKTNERYFEAGIQVSRLAEKLKRDNTKLKSRLDVLGKRGVFSGAKSKGGI